MPTQMPEPMRWLLVINPIADLMALIHASIQCELRVELNIMKLMSYKNLD